MRRRAATRERQIAALSARLASDEPERGEPQSRYGAALRRQINAVEREIGKLDAKLASAAAREETSEVIALGAQKLKVVSHLAQLRELFRRIGAKDFS